MIRWIAGLALSLATPATAAPCHLAKADQAWLDRALANWPVAERRFLHLPPVPMPEVVAFDAACLITGTPRPGHPTRWRGTTHGATVTFPDGKTAPAGVLSFAAPAEHGKQRFFAMSTPSVWRAGGVTSELGLETLIDGVLLHEMMHTRQAYFATATLDALQQRWKLPDDQVTDDALQDRFGKDPAYAAAYARERDLLFAAAAAPSEAEARALAGQALDAMRARRARWFTGDQAYWAEFDDIFLQMEGLGQWLIYRWYTAGPRRTYTPAVALAAVRRKRNYWTQDEGLALMLVVDRLVPDWEKAAFAARPALAEALLAMAAGRRH